MRLVTVGLGQESVASVSKHISSLFPGGSGVVILVGLLEVSSANSLFFIILSLFISNFPLEIIRVIFHSESVVFDEILSS